VTVYRQKHNTQEGIFYMKYLTTIR